MVYATFILILVVFGMEFYTAHKIHTGYRKILAQNRELGELIALTIAIANVIDIKVITLARAYGNTEDLQ
jgi:hypothetical protein